MAFGVTSDGFVLKRLQDIKDEIEADLREAFGPGVNLEADTLLGELVGIFAEREALVWELAQAVFFSQYPGTSEDVPLDNVASITGAERKTPTKSTIIGQLLFGTLGTTILQGRVVSVVGAPADRFVTLADVTLIAGVDEIQTISFSDTPDAGTFKLAFNGVETADIDFDDTSAEVEAALEALSTIGTGNVSVTGTIDDTTGLTIAFLNPGPTGLGKRDVSIITSADNLLELASSPVIITITEATKGVPQGLVNMEAETEGSTVANAAALTEIETPVTGWDTTVNPTDATVGQDEESNAEFKLRRIEQIALAGAATVEAIRSDLLAINDVTAVRVFQNNTDIVDLEGRPPHSVDIVVQGGDEDLIASTIFNTVAAGITIIGDITKLVTDSQGFIQTIKFSRPTEVEVHLEIDLTVNSAIFPDNGVAQVELAVLDNLAELLQVGEDVIVHGSAPSVECSTNSVPGITDIVIRIGIVVSPTLDANIPIDERSIADFDTSRITVVVP